MEGLDPDVVRARLGAASARPITLSFGAPEIFQGHGVLLPCVAGSTDFESLRQLVLGSDNIRHHTAHLTLAHPRNPKSPGNSMPALARITVAFDAIHCIQQADSAPWQVIDQFPLAGTVS